MFLFVAASCTSTAPEVSSREPIIIQAADLTISLLPKSRDELRDIYGSNSDRLRNPYIDHPSKITKKRLVVFDVNITTEESTVLFELRENSLMIGGQTAQGTTRQLLANLWKGYASQEEQAGLHDLMLRSMLEREISVSPDNPAQGYIVFAHNYPEGGGDGLITFHVKTPDGAMGTLSESIQFTNKGVEEEGDTMNTGIFSEE